MTEAWEQVWKSIKEELHKDDGRERTLKVNLLSNGEVEAVLTVLEKPVSEREYRRCCCENLH